MTVCPLSCTGGPYPFCQWDGDEVRCSGCVLDFLRDANWGETAIPWWSLQRTLGCQVRNWYGLRGARKPLEPSHE